MHVCLSVVHKEGFAGIHSGNIYGCLKDFGFGLAEVHVVGAEGLVEKSFELPSAGQKGVAIAPVVDEGVVVAEEVKVVVGQEAGLDEVELVGLHLANEAEQAVLYIVVGVAAPVSLRQRPDKLISGERASLKVEEEPALLVGVKKLACIIHANFLKSFYALLDVEMEQDAAEIEDDVFYFHLQ